MSALSDNHLFLLSIATVATVMITSIMMMLILLLKQNQKTLHYNLELHRAALSADREFYEKQLAKTAMQMTASEDRWRDANHLLLSDRNLGNLNSAQSSKPDVGAFMAGFGIIPSNLEVDRRLVMVLTPFSEDEEGAFEIIKDACSRVGLTAVRGDEQFISGDILAHVVRLIVRARLIIANISTRNANVFYELGIAHALNKPTILVSRSLNDAPFDIKSYRMIVYHEENELRRLLTESLARVMTEIGSPISSFE